MKTLRWLGHAILLTVSGVACGTGPEKGVPPEAPSGEEVVAIGFDVSRHRLLKAYPHALYQSRDSGRSWEAIPIPPPIRNGRIVAVSAPPRAAGTLYVAGRGFGVLRSQDDGTTWRRLNRGLPSREIEAFAAHADLANTLYASVEGKGVYRSEDGGRTWERMDGGPGRKIGQLFHSNLGGSMKTGWLYAGTPDGVHRTMDCFCGWHRAGSLSSQSGSYGVAFDPNQPEHLYASGAAGMFRSRDGGESWEKVDSGTPERIGVAFDPATDVLYAVTREGNILRSRDEGARWERADE